MNKLNGYLSISEFAEIANTNRKKLIYYDRIGLFKPSYIAENGYRYYRHRQIETYFTINTLSKLGLPLKEIKKYLMIQNPDQAQVTFHEINRVIQNKIVELQGYSNLINMRNQNLREAKCAKMYSPYIKHLSNRYILASPIFNIFTDEIPPIIYTNLWNRAKELNIAYGYPIGYIISKKNFINKKYKQISQVFFKLNKNDRKRADKTLPSEKYLINYGMGHYGDTEEIYHQLYEYIRLHNLQPVGEITEEYLLDEVVAEDPDSFIIKVSVPVKNMLTV